MRAQILAAQRCLARGILLLLTPALGGFQQSAAKEVDFAREVLPILSNKCFVCHGPDTKKEEDPAESDSKEEMLKRAIAMSLEDP